MAAAASSCVKAVAMKAAARSHPAPLASGMGRQVAHRVHPATLPGHVQHLGDSRLQPLMGVGDHQLDPAQATAGERAQELGPEGLGFGGADRHAEDFTSAVAVDADGDDDGDRNDAPA